MSGITYNKDDLVTGVIQDADTGRVLMVGYLNAESLRLTKETGRVHFWSRSRSELWEKGATSGNYLNLVSIEQDCDSDALLISARPEGPTCHTGSTSCFGELDLQGFAQLEELWLTIGTRIAVPTPESYTARLVEAGPDLTGRKLVEEATETLIAAKNHAHGENDDVRVAEEAADVAYHLLVLLAERGIPAATVLEELRRRSV